MYLNFYYKNHMLLFVANKKHVKPFLWKLNILKTNTLKLKIFIKKSKSNFLQQQQLTSSKMIVFTNFFFYNLVFKFNKFKVKKNLRLFSTKYHKRKIRFVISPVFFFCTDSHNFFETICAVNLLFIAKKIMQIKKLLKLHNNFLSFPWIFKFNIQSTYFITKALTKNNLIFLRLFRYTFVRSTILFLKLLNFIQNKKKLSK